MEQKVMGKFTCQGTGAGEMNPDEQVASGRSLNTHEFPGASLGYNFRSLSLARKKGKPSMSLIHM